MPSDNQSKSAPFNFKDLRFAWFVGHATVLLCTLFYYLSVIVLHRCTFFYRLAYVAAILSYSIILYHAYKPSKAHEPFVKRILLDENFQYCSLAVYFLVSRRVSISLLPFAIYAVFHTADYTRTVLLPAFAPQNTQLQEQLKSVTSRFRNQAMDYVSKVEVFGVFARLLLGLFVLRSTVFSILFYLHFLRMRYYMSPQMRKTLTGIYTRVDAFLLPPTAHSKVPPAVSKAYSTVKSILCQSKPNPSPSTHQ